MLNNLNRGQFHKATVQGNSSSLTSTSLKEDCYSISLSPCFLSLILLAAFVLPFLINAVRFNLASLMHLLLCGHPGLAHVPFVNRQTNHKVCVKNNCGFAVKEPHLEEAFSKWTLNMCVCVGWGWGVHTDTCGVNCIFHSSNDFKGLRWEWKLPYVTFETNWISAPLCMGQWRPLLGHGRHTDTRQQ